MSAMDCVDALGCALQVDAVRQGAQAAAAARTFLECFRRLNVEYQEELRGLLTPAERRKIANLSLSLAEEAIEAHDCSWIGLGLLAHGFEDFRDDPRNNLRSLAALEFAAKRLGQNLECILETVTSELSEHSLKHIGEYCTRPESLRSLKVMGLRLDPGSERTRFIAME